MSPYSMWWIWFLNQVVHNMISCVSKLASSTINVCHWNMFFHSVSICILRVWKLGDVPTNIDSGPFSLSQNGRWIPIIISQTSLNTVISSYTSWNILQTIIWLLSWVDLSWIIKSTQFARFITLRWSARRRSFMMINSVEMTLSTILYRFNLRWSSSLHVLSLLDLGCHIHVLKYIMIFIDVLILIHELSLFHDVAILLHFLTWIKIGSTERHYPSCKIYDIFVFFVHLSINKKFII